MNIESIPNIVSTIPPLSQKVKKTAPPKIPKWVRQSDLSEKGMIIRIYPTKEQIFLIQKWIGATRFVWNWALSQQIEFYEKNNKFLPINKISCNLTVFKKQPEMVWLNIVPRTILSRTLNNLKLSWKNFFEGVQKKRVDKPGFPQFRRKGDKRESVSFQMDSRHLPPITKNKKVIRISGLGEIKAVFSEHLVGDVSRITIFKKGERWFASLNLLNVSKENLQRMGNSFNNSSFKNFINDFNDEFYKKGLAAFDASVVEGAVVTNDGINVFSLFNESVKKRDEKFENQKKRYQKAYTRKMNYLYEKAGFNRDENGAWPKSVAFKAKEKGFFPTKQMKILNKKIAIVCTKDSFRKKDAIHQFTKKLIKEHHTIVFETLSLKGMAKGFNSGFRKSFHEAAIGELFRQIKYKTKWYDRNLILIEKWFASSKRCSNKDCHKKNKDLKLKDRQWVCAHCEEIHERDKNAAFNLWQEGWRLLEEVIQHDSANMLAAGSVVKGWSGKYLEATKKKVVF